MKPLTDHDTPFTSTDKMLLQGIHKFGKKLLENSPRGSLPLKIKMQGMKKAVQADRNSMLLYFCCD